MKGRRYLKVAAVLVVVVYCSLLAYQTGVTLNSYVESRGARQVSEAPNSEVSEYNRSSSKNITAQTPQTNLEDVFISVKTTRHYQDTRLPIILKTWFQLAKEQTWFFTDIDNPAHQARTNGHMVNTNCSDSHERKHLCCKMSVEYDFFLESKKKWFCHFDDDNYVNVPRLVATLRRFDPQREWYLGRTSVYEPVKLYKKPTNELMFSFWFATGGAGFCISRALALRMIPVASAGRFISICEGIRLPDDVSMGFIIEHLMKQRLTVVDEFHSHLEQMRFLAPESFERQISFSYSRVGSDWNVVQADAFDERVDPTRFLSLHCLLFPHFKFCPRR